MSRLNLDDGMLEITTKMSGGHPIAMNVIMQLFAEGSKIDKDTPMGGIGTLLNLDSLEIYGTDIYILYNDICDRDLVKTIAVVRASQLGFLDGKILKDACSRQDRSGKKMIDVELLYKKVYEYLPKFNR